MLSMLARDWRVFAVRGIAAIIFGIGAFVFPNETLNALVWLFGAYLLVDGAVLLIALVSGDPIARRNSWAIALISVLNLALGLAAFVWTDTVAFSMLYVVAFWSIVSGTLQVMSAIYLRRELQGEFWLALGGIVSVAFGILLIAFPSQGLDLTRLARGDLGDRLRDLQPWSRPIGCTG